MKNIIHQRWQSSLRAILVLVLASGAFPGAAVAQKEQSIGERFGSREPTTCADTKAPAQGAITAELAKKYFICQEERVSGDRLYLVEDVKVEVGGGIPYAAIIGHRSLQEIDVDHPVYPIRGSYVSYQISDPVTTSGGPPGRNATSYNHPKATGYCYKTTFGDWRCYMADNASSNQENIRHHVAPPGGKKGVAATTSDNGGAKGDDGSIKPDLSEMEKYFEVIKHDYNPVDGRCNFVVSAKKPTNIFKWYLTAYDADGVKVSDTSFNGNVVSPAIGEPTRIYTFAPIGKDMKQVTKIVIAHRPD